MQGFGHEYDVFPISLPSTVVPHTSQVLGMLDTAEAVFARRSIRCHIICDQVSIGFKFCKQGTRGITTLLIAPSASLVSTALRATSLSIEVDASSSPPSPATGPM